MGEHTRQRREDQLGSGAGFFEDTTAAFLDKAVPVDVVAALDNDALESAADHTPSVAEGDSRLYGVGNSNKVIYDLDKGIIKSLIVPDEFTMGYQSVAQMAQYLQSRITPMEDPEVNFYLVTRDNIFSEGFETLLFASVY